jgi:tryptophanyl-tRNA synthetase
MTHMLTFYNFLIIMDKSKLPTVTPWEVKDQVDYTKIVLEFGTTPFSEELLSRFERLCKRPLHHWLKRGVYFSHRSLEELLDNYEKGKSFYIYTGRGPSSESLHLGHMIQFMFVKWLQEVFDVHVVIQLTDDEKFFWKDIAIEETGRLAIENIKDILAIGFNPKKTFIFTDLCYMGNLYPNVCKIQKKLTASTVKAIFGFKDSDNIGKFAFPAIEAAPAFSTCFPHLFGDENVQCLIPCAIDQDPFFRMARDVAPRIGYLKPVIMHSKFFPALKVPNSKMSASDPNGTIYMSDSKQQIVKKINRSFSGGRDTQEEHERLGGDVESSVTFKYIEIFEADDEKVETIRQQYSAGTMSSKQLKEELVNVLLPIVENHQKSRINVTRDVIESFMKINKF